MDLAIQQGKTITLRDEYDSFKTKTFEEGKYEARPLQLQSVRGGERIAPYYDLQTKKAFYKDNLQHFSPAERRLINPHYYKVDISEDLYKLKIGILDSLNKEIAGFRID